MWSIFPTHLVLKPGCAFLGASRRKVNRSEAARERRPEKLDAAAAPRAQGARRPLCPARAAVGRRPWRRALRGRHRRRCRRAASAGCPRPRPESRAAFQPWLEKVEASEDPLFFTVIDKASGKVAGRQTLMRIDPTNGVIEIGNILWGPLIARKPAATEAQFLFAQIYLRRSRLPPLRVEVQQPQRAVEARRRTFRLPVRGHLPPAHDRQGREPRHRLVFDHRQGMAGAREKHMRAGSIPAILIVTETRKDAWKTFVSLWRERLFRYQRGLA